MHLHMPTVHRASAVWDTQGLSLPWAILDCTRGHTGLAQHGARRGAGSRKVNDCSRPSRRQSCISLLSLAVSRGPLKLLRPTNVIMRASFSGKIASKQSNFVPGHRAAKVASLSSLVDSRGPPKLPRPHLPIRRCAIPCAMLGWRSRGRYDSN